MKARLLVALAAGLLVGADPAPDLGEVAQPQVIPPDSRWTWTFEGRTIINHFQKGGVWMRVSPPGPGGKYVPEPYTLNPRASPPRIDTTAFGRMHRHGIYKLEGDRMTICMGPWDTATRPTTFAHRPKAGQYLYVLKRLK